jgi:hypothetical protein
MNFVHKINRTRTHVCMHMWGEMMPKRGQLDFSARITPYALGLLVSATDHMFIMVACPYMGLDW